MGPGRDIRGHVARAHPEDEIPGSSKRGSLSWSLRQLMNRAQSGAQQRAGFSGRAVCAAETVDTMTSDEHDIDLRLTDQCVTYFLRKDRIVQFLPI